MFKTITDHLSIAAQITVDDIVGAENAGIKRIIMNRPDHEEPGQPDTDTLKNEATRRGIDWIDIPVAAGGFTLDAVAEMGSALKGSPGPVLAFCRTGTRSCFLWALFEASSGTMAANEITEKARDAGYDLSALSSRLEHLCSNRP